MFSLRNIIHNEYEFVYKIFIETHYIFTKMHSSGIDLAITAQSQYNKTGDENGMRFRRGGFPMGISSLDEWHIQQTDEQNVRASHTVLDA